MSLTSYLAAAPKAELHVHLPATVQPETLLTLAHRNGIELPANDVEGLRRWFAYRDFAHFVDVFVAVASCMRTGDDYELVAYELGAEMARQNIRYAEVTFSPSTHAFRLGIPHEVYFGGLTRGRERARSEFGVEINWICDIVRSLREPSNVMPYADYTTEVAIASKNDGVVALGLGGGEEGGPPEMFERQFERARAAGLHSIPHGGELMGPEHVWGALRALGAERIGHGVRSIEDPKLVRYLAETGVPLEVCPTSNICLGVYPSYEAHPLRRLHEAGVPISVNSDDPTLFNTTLNEEVAILAAEFGLDVHAIDEILLNGIKHSFVPEPRRSELVTQFTAELDALKAVHLNGSGD